MAELEEKVITGHLHTQVTGWQPGDVVLAEDTQIWTRADAQSIRDGWPWAYGAPHGPLVYQGHPEPPEGSVEETVPVRPLVLLVRDGRAVQGQ